MDIKERLEKIGLSANEVKVYLYLVDHGQSKAGKIAKGAKIQRSSAYSAINTLVAKGLIGYCLIGKVKLFQATSPERILEHIKEQEEMIEEILPELSQRHKAVKKEGQVRMFKGKKGVKAVFKDIIRTKENNYVFGEDGNLRKMMPVFCDQFIRDQNKNNIETRIITRIRECSYSEGTVYKYVDEAVKSNVAVNIYGEKVAIIIWTDDPEAIMIENKETASAMKAYFDFMWENAKK